MNVFLRVWYDAKPKLLMLHIIYIIYIVQPLYAWYIIANFTPVDYR